MEGKTKIKKRRIGASLVAVVATAFGVLVGRAQPASATTCTLQTVGHVAYLIIDSQTAGTIKQVYCAANRTAYAQFDIDQTWYNQGHRSWNVWMETNEEPAGNAHSNSSAWTNSSLLSYRGAAMPIDNGLLGKDFRVALSFRWNSCYVGTFFGDHGVVVQTDVHDYSDGINWNVVTSDYCAS